MSGTNLWLQIFCKPGILTELVGRRIVYAAEDIVYHTSLSLATLFHSSFSLLLHPYALTFVKTCILIRNIRKLHNNGLRVFIAVMRHFDHGNSCKGKHLLGAGLCFRGPLLSWRGALRHTHRKRWCWRGD